jgi:hypothetical protein
MFAMFNASRGSIIITQLFHFQMNEPACPDVQRSENLIAIARGAPRRLNAQVDARPGQCGAGDSDGSRAPRHASRETSQSSPSRLLSMWSSTLASRCLLSPA